jgi:hypothetical protein
MVDGLAVSPDVIGLELVEESFHSTSRCEKI